MRLKATMVSAGLMAAASIAMAGPAAAQIPICAGTENTIVLCVDPTGATLIEDCVYAGEPPCKPVTVPGPTVSCGGSIGAPLCAVNYNPPPIS